MTTTNLTLTAARANAEQYRGVPGLCTHCVDFPAFGEVTEADLVPRPIVAGEDRCAEHVEYRERQARWAGLCAGVRS